MPTVILVSFSKILLLTLFCIYISYLTAFHKKSGNFKGSRIRSRLYEDNGLKMDVFDHNDLTKRLLTFDPFIRVILTANGNLQHLMSAFYGTSIDVKIIESQPHDAENVFYRNIELLAFNKVFCRAKGIVRIIDESCARYFQDSNIGVGQLLRSLDTYPVFTLKQVGYEMYEISRCDNKENLHYIQDVIDEPSINDTTKVYKLFRDYSLKCRYFVYDIREIFENDILDVPSSIIT